MKHASLAYVHSVQRIHSLRITKFLLANQSQNVLNTDAIIWFTLLCFYASLNEMLEINNLKKQSYPSTCFISEIRLIIGYANRDVWYKVVCIANLQIKAIKLNNLRKWNNTNRYKFSASVSKTLVLLFFNLGIQNGIW